jgi:hypothetical protein
VRGALLLLLLLLLLLSIARFGSPPRRKAKADPVGQNPLSEQSAISRQPSVTADRRLKAEG